MNKKLVPLVFFIVVLVGCQTTNTIFHGTATPIPGLDFPVSDLFLSLDSFPAGWSENYGLPEKLINDPTVNHVFREWGGEEYGRAWQNIWRAHSIVDAEDHFAEIRISQFTYKRTPIPEIFYTEFTQPEEVDYISELADEAYLACGWDSFAYCEYVIRYKNYVSRVHLPLEATFKGYSSEGLTYEQIESILIDVDQIFEELFNEIYP